MCVKILGCGTKHQKIELVEAPELLLVHMAQVPNHYAVCFRVFLLEQGCFTVPVNYNEENGIPCQIIQRGLWEPRLRPMWALRLPAAWFDLTPKRRGC